MTFRSVYSGRRVLVTGHTGFKGSWLSLWLNALGADVRGYSLAPPFEPSLFDVFGLNSKIQHQEADIRDLSKLQSAFEEFQPEVVFHLAAQPLVRRSYAAPHETFETNVLGTLNVLEGIRHTSSVRAAVIVTTDKVYLNREWEYKYRETDSLGGKDPYSSSKACTELMVDSYCRSFFSEGSAPFVASARAGNVIGGGDWSVDRIVPDAIRAWSRGQELEVRSPSATRPWQHVLDCLGGYLLLGTKLFTGSEGVRGEAFNFGPDGIRSQTVLELIRDLSRPWPDAKIRVQESAQAKKQEAGMLRLTCEKAATHLNWSPVISYSEAIDMTAEWYRRSADRHSDLLQYSLDQIQFYTDKAGSFAKH